MFPLKTKQVIMVILVSLLLFPVMVEAAVWIVDWQGGGHFKTIQEAVDAASDGDTVLVKGLGYDSFLIDGKALL
jgi:hypothetical protein